MGLLPGLGLKQQEVAEFGKFLAPGGMEKPQLERKDAQLRVLLRRDYSWYRWDTMGPNYPAREEVFLLLGDPAAGEEQRESPEEWMRRKAGELEPMGVRMPTWNEEAAGVPRPKLQWKREGNLQWAEGKYIVNQIGDECWAVIASAPEKSLVVGYRVRKSDASLEKAKRVVQEMAASFSPAAGLGEMFANEKERPARLYREAMEKMTASLQQMGLRMPKLGEVYEQGPYIVSFTEDADGEHRLWLLQEIGAIAADGGAGSEEPKPAGMYQTVGALREVDGEWELWRREKMNVHEELLRVLRGRAPGPGKAAIYAEQASFFGGDYYGERTMKDFAKFAGEAKKLLDSGKLAKPWK